jgi:large subunit ribosomal protein L6
MSRIGKLAIQVKESVTVTIDNGQIKVAGPKGELIQDIHPTIAVKLEGDKIIVSPQEGQKDASSFQGLMRTLIFNMAQGVTDGFTKNLEFHGVGYRASVQGKELVLNLGFSHPVHYKIPEGIEIKVEKNLISITGIDKQKVGQVAAEIRSLKKPEPYKGKGIRYQGEKIRRKAGKAAAKG